MSVEQGDRVPVGCPACGTETPHEVLKARGQATVRCLDCGHTHKVRVEREREVERDVVVSQDGDSTTTTVDVPVEETLEAGEEFIVDTPEAILQVRITALDLQDGRRADEAPAEDVSTIWTRVVDNVSVPVTVHPKEGDGRESTRSLKVQVPGDYEFTVGETESFGDDEFEIEGVKLRDDAEGYGFDKLDHDGDTVFAKDVKRVYARDTTTTAWSAW